MTLAFYSHKRHDQSDLRCPKPEMCGTLLRIFSNIIVKYTPFYHFYRTLLRLNNDITPYILTIYNIFASLKLYKGGILKLYVFFDKKHLIFNDKKTVDEKPAIIFVVHVEIM